MTSSSLCHRESFSYERWYWKLLRKLLIRRSFDLERKILKTATWKPSWDSARVIRVTSALFISAQNVSNEVCRYERNTRFVSSIFIPLVLRHVSNACAQEPVWVPQDRQKPLVCTGNRTTAFSVAQLVMYELHRLQFLRSH